MRWPDNLDVGIGLSDDRCIKRDIPTVLENRILVLMDLQPIQPINRLKWFKYEHLHLLQFNPIFVRENNGLDFVTCEHSFTS